MQSLSRSTLESGQKGKFFRRQKFALLHIKDQSNPQNFQGAERYNLIAISLKSVKIDKIMVFIR